MLIFKREEISKVVVNKPYEVRFDLPVVLVLYFKGGLLTSIFFWAVRGSCTMYRAVSTKVVPQKFKSVCDNVD